MKHILKITLFSIVTLAGIISGFAGATFSSVGTGLWIAYSFALLLHNPLISYLEKRINKE